MEGMGLSRAAFDDVSAERMWRDGHLKWTMQGAGVLGADAAEMDFGTAPVIAAALRSAVDRGALGYVSPAFERELSEACAAWQRDRHGWHVSPEDVRALPDVIRALHLAIEYFSRPGSPVIVPVPAYMPFLVVPGLLGRQTIEIEMVLSEGRYVYDLDALRGAYRRGGHLLLLCNPHNPLGRVMEADELVAISEVVDKYGGRVFADEVHAPIVYPGLRHIPYASLSTTAADQAITAVSASKAWNIAGLKCAQVVLSNATDRDRWTRLGRLATDGTSILGVTAGIAAFRSGGDWLHGVLNYLDGNRRLLDELLRGDLPAVSYRQPDGTYLGWLDCRDLDFPGANAAEFFLRKARVALVDGAACGRPGRGFVRLNFATSRSILDRMVTRLASSVASMRGAAG